MSALEQIKQAARHLFAQRGIDGVTVREIVSASHQKNHGSLTYHFGTKEALVRELVADGARVIDRRRCDYLDNLEKQGGPNSVRQVVEALVHPSVNIAEELGGIEENYTRFITLLSLTHRDVFMTALENQLNSGYVRCLKYLRVLMPDIPNTTMNRRMVFMETYLGSVLSLRERALANRTRKKHMWMDDDAILDVIETVSAILLAPTKRER